MFLMPLLLYDEGIEKGQTMKNYKVMAANFHGTYRAGEHVAETQAEAIEQAKAVYRRSAGYMNDAGAFRWYVVDRWPDEEMCNPASEY